MKLRVLILAGLALGAIGLSAFALRAPADTPERIAKECRFIATVEARRMVRGNDYGPAPFEIWRATNQTSSALGLSKRDKDALPWEARLLVRLPKNRAPIDCGPALDAAKVPIVQKYNEGAPVQADRFRYSRVVFSPGDRYALARVTTCWMDNGMWEENSDVAVWRRRGQAWERLAGDVLLLYMPPTRAPPMRCFETPAP